MGRLLIILFSAALGFLAYSAFAEEAQASPDQPIVNSQLKCSRPVKLPSTIEIEVQAIVHRDGCEDQEIGARLEKGRQVAAENKETRRIQAFFKTEKPFFRELRRTAEEIYCSVFGLQTIVAEEARFSSPCEQTELSAINPRSLRRRSL